MSMDSMLAEVESRWMLSKMAASSGLAGSGSCGSSPPPPGASPPAAAPAAHGLVGCLCRHPPGGVPPLTPRLQHSWVGVKNVHWAARDCRAGGVRSVEIRGWAWSRRLWDEMDPHWVGGPPQE